MDDTAEETAPSVSSELPEEVFIAVAERALKACTQNLVGGIRGDIGALSEEIMASQDANAAIADDVRAAVASCATVFDEAARASWTPAQLDSALRVRNFPWGDVAILVELWRREEARIKDRLRDACLKGGKLNKMSWRVDVCQSSRHVEDVGEPCAIVELDVQSRRGAAAPAGEGSTLRFEMDREKVAVIHAEIQRLRGAIAAAAGPPPGAQM